MVGNDRKPNDVLKMYGDSIAITPDYDGCCDCSGSYSISLIKYYTYTHGHNGTVYILASIHFLN